MASVPPDVISQQLQAQAETRIAAPSRASDADLLQAIGVGSEPAFEELRHRYHRAIERAFRSIVGIDLEDCAREVFVRIWRKAPLYDRRRGSAPAWLLTLTRRTALNVRRPERERSVVELAYFDDLSQSRIAAELGVPLGSVKSWTRRGLNRLVTLLAEEPE
ncbi:MAG TPA: sigma factor-like helix-turn-helix DNA-binding protein [Gaiellaceae bacterium]|nr:sigma factor-like helix-turn-helix DNA-binding protein [Gaiellaceae bacterium]